MSASCLGGSPARSLAGFPQVGTPTTLDDNRTVTRIGGTLVDDEGHYFNGTDPVDVTMTARDAHYRLKRAAYNIEGAVRCFAGARQGTACGRVSNTDTSVKYKDGARVSHLALMIGACSAKGDSGGPVCKDHLAYGIVSGGGGSGNKCKTPYSSAVTPMHHWHVGLWTP